MLQYVNMSLRTSVTVSLTFKYIYLRLKGSSFCLIPFSYPPHNQSTEGPIFDPTHSDTFPSLPCYKAQAFFFFFLVLQIFHGKLS